MNALIKIPFAGQKSIVVMLCMVFVLFLIASGCDKSEILPKHYTVNFMGEGICIEPQSVVHGSYATAPENPERKGCYFDGWFTDNGIFANEWDFKTDIVTQDTTLYAKWKEITLQGTKWKLAGIVDVQTGNLKELEPKDCDGCYRFTFDTDSTAVGWITSNDLFVWLRPVLSVVTLSKALGSDFYIEDAILFRSVIKTIISYELNKNELKFYYNDNKNYLLFTRKS